MDHFFKLLSEGYFKVKYDTEYDNKWFKTTHSLTNVSVNCKADHETTHGVTFNVA